MAKELPTIQDYKRPNINFSPKIAPIKDFKDKSQINVRYPLISPFAYAHIFWDKKESEIMYEIEEPILTKEETEHKEEVLLAMKELVNFDKVVEKNEEALLDYIDKMFKIISIELGINISYQSYEKIYYYLARDFLGFNETDPLLRDYYVEDIECNGTITPVFIVHRKFRNIKTNLVFNKIETLSSFVEKLAQRSGKYVSYAQPILDSSLPDGSRVNATYTKDITSKGPTFTIRKFTKTPWTPPQLVGFLLL
jgi:flagellar protein FlaI